MSPKSTPKKDALRAKLLEVAEAEIENGGIVALRARDLANEAGCALGAIYTVFGDLGEIAIEINRRTMLQIADHLRGSIEGMENEDPGDMIITLAQAYRSYAEDQPQRWRTLFSIGLPPADSAEGFYDALAPITNLFAEQLDRLTRLSTTSERNRNARAIFSCVHGMISLGEEPRLSAMDPRDLDRMISRVVGTLCDKDQKL
ncbi:TetR family transcriptional regulator [Actibacterium atlanticum]|uniref:TetR family transcriptional regulator n=1 Tax=Actibacterium atlanticum TaxID=1461693 RepID=A0A058ZK01_9RHOB|nr:TetR/AcrR family transcriptional regulator [Actibacterium atlanticum]KCV81944.1 TetR family transcriptional regulator [Actibacterium atlanticum]